MSVTVKGRAGTVIVGGGLAGLTLAHRIEQTGHDYLMLEARDRLGGRVLSSAATAAPSRYDLGPAWFWPGQPRIARLLDELDLTAFQQFSHGQHVFQDATGRIFRNPAFASAMADAMRVTGGMGRLVDSLGSRLPSARLGLGHAVSHIERIDHGYAIHGRTARGPFVVQADDHVVLALPPRVTARTIDFDPTLPDEVLRSLIAIPTWMAAHAKLIAVYDRPFWREAGFSGEAFSLRGPLAEIHDASPNDDSAGALFGFVGLAAEDPARQMPGLKSGALQQLAALFGPSAADPVDVLFKDWSTDVHTATTDDRPLRSHPAYGMPPALSSFAQTGLIFAATELGDQFGGLLEGALEAADRAFDFINSQLGATTARH